MVFGVIGYYNNHMYHTPNKRKKRAQLAFIYSLMALAVISIVAVLILVIQGYRYNRFDGKLEQGGLVQFNSRPAGATVSVDGLTLANRTASKITLTSGTHEVTISREGYTTWKKTVTVKPGGVLWLNYAQLLPVAPTVTTATTYQGATTPLATPNHKELALFEVPTQPVVTMTTLNTDKPQSIKLTIPEAAYTAPAEGISSDFSLVSWDSGNRYLIVKHVVGEKTEYISVDTDDLARSQNISTLLGVDIVNVRYSTADSGIVYLLTATHELRRADLGQATLSGPLASNVAEFSMPDRDTIVFSSLADADGVRTVNYLSTGLSTPKQLKSYKDLGDRSLHVSTGTYYGERYVAVSHGDAIDIYRGDLPRSDSTSELTLTKVASYTLDGGVDYLGMSPGENRFVYVAKGSSIVTYDLELLQKSVVTLQSPLTRDVEWMDGYHLMTTGGGRGYFFDFDGTNGQLFASSALAHPAVLADGNTYLYYFAQGDATVKLQRIKMIAD